MNHIAWLIYIGVSNQFIHTMYANDTKILKLAKRKSWSTVQSSADAWLSNESIFVYSAANYDNCFKATGVEPHTKKQMSENPMSTVA